VQRGARAWLNVGNQWAYFKIDYNVQYRLTSPRTNFLNFVLVVRFKRQSIRINPIVSDGLYIDSYVYMYLHIYPTRCSIIYCDLTTRPVKNWSSFFIGILTTRRVHVFYDNNIPAGVRAHARPSIICTIFFFLSNHKMHYDNNIYGIKRFWNVIV
jgi:lipopolysaccharide assembly outer membrane protein LptD (OstA)